MKSFTTTLIASALIIASSGTLLGQVRPVYDRGTVGLVQLLKRLNTSTSALMIGAHPDDEDTAMLAYLARGESARTAYLSLTRGDGGQNIIGPELGESLGLIRTEELVQARRLDGAEQFFGRAYDYGFSKTLAEAKSKWDEKIVLCDTVAVIRRFQPNVVISQFSGTPSDGHGQHQFAGYITPLAVRAAADASQCTDAGPVWNVQKLYQRTRGAEPRLRVNTGRYDPIIGRTYFEIAMEARSQHKSQEQGVLELRGDQFSGANLAGSDARETGVFEGVDASPAGVARAVGADETLVRELFAVARTASTQLDIGAPEKLLPTLAKGYSAAVTGETASGNGSGRAFFAERKRMFAEAIVHAAGLQIDALADRETVVPGESIDISVKAFSPHKDAIRINEIGLIVPARPSPSGLPAGANGGWSVTRRPAPTANSAAFVTREAAIASEYFTVSLPRDAELTTPYWLVEPRQGDLFTQSGPANFHGLPFQPTVPRTVLSLEVAGTVISVERPIEYRFADDIRGEIRRNVDVVPLVSVELDQAMMIVPMSERPQTRQVVMTVTNHSTRPVAGSVSLSINAPKEWKVTSSSNTFDIQRSGERQAVSFNVTIPARAGAGSYQINAQAAVGELLASSTMRAISYPHIQTHRFYRRAVTDVRIIDLKTTPVKLGYLAGSGDRVPEAIRQMGFDLENISESELANGRLSRFDAIVVGIRAYQVRPDVVANNRRLLDYARDGGTLIVQYQLSGYAQQNLPPFPTQMGPRVADETAPVTIVEPDHPVFNYPNKITQEDFKGWVQERNLYNFTNMDPKYAGLLEAHDGAEAENRGGLVVADIGKGKYVYCSYSFFRQLPAGVPGAYRLLANLLSLPVVKRPRS